MEKDQNSFEELKSFWSDLTKSEKIAWLFNIVGFIASVVTLVELARASDTVLEQSTTTFLTPGISIGLWVIGCFTYLVFLHSYWQKNRRQEKYDAAFRNFVLIDLLYFFKQPILLSPLMLLILGLYAVMAISNSPATAVIFTIFLVFVFFIILYLKFTDGDSLFSNRVDISDDFRTVVEQEWASLEQRVSIELARRRWVHPDNFSDIAATRGFSTQEIRFILAIYASRHPDTTKFGDLMEKAYAFSTPQLKVSGVLVNLDQLGHPYSIR